MQKMLYIIKAWTTIQNSIKKCILCKIRTCEKKNPITAPIPDLIISRNPFYQIKCFTVCSFDIAGPFYILDNGKERTFYYLLVTCTASRCLEKREPQEKH